MRGSVGVRKEAGAEKEQQGGAHKDLPGVGSWAAVDTSAGQGTGAEAVVGSGRQREVRFRCQAGGGWDTVVGRLGVASTLKLIKEAWGGAEMLGGGAGRGEQRAGPRPQGGRRSWRASALRGRRKADV